VKTRFEVSYSPEVGSAWSSVLRVIVGGSGRRCKWPTVDGFWPDMRGE
jgi:hypothetical protein